MANLRGRRAVSKRLVASYVLDWIVIAGIAAVGAALNVVTPHMKPFSLTDPTISYPFVGDTIPTWLLIVVSLVAPALIITIVILLLVPGPKVGRRDAPLPRAWVLKLWELHTGLAGLCLACAIALLVTDGMKQLIGKPRPNLLSRCIPDTENAQQYAVKDLNGVVVSGALLVTSAICQQTDKSVRDEGFRAFPSGHSSFSAAGLTYLTLFLCAKFAIAIPFAISQPSTRSRRSAHQRNGTLESSASEGHNLQSDFASVAGGSRNRAAAPPNHLLVLALIPVGASLYISGTRYMDNQHAGWDISFAFLEGFLIGWFAFRWYHLPVRMGAGWSWGPRSKEAAFGIGFGVPGYAKEHFREYEDEPHELGNRCTDGTHV